MARNKNAILPLSKTAFVFGLLVWLYAIAMQVAHPESVGWTFTYWLRVRMDIAGEISFLISLLGFFVWQFAAKKD